VVYSTKKHKNFKNQFLVMIEIVIIFKDETLNLQGIGTFLKIRIYSKI
jgi:hypothetical protein